MSDIWEALAKAINNESNCLGVSNVDQIQADPAISLRLAIAAAAGASNRIHHGQIEEASACQEQSRLWLTINERVAAVAREAMWASQPEPEDPNRPAEDATVR